MWTSYTKKSKVDLEVLCSLHLWRLLCSLLCRLLWSPLSSQYSKKAPAFGAWLLYLLQWDHSDLFFSSVGLCPWFWSGTVNGQMHLQWRKWNSIFPPAAIMSFPAVLRDPFSLGGRKITKPASSKAVLAIASSHQEVNCLQKALPNSAWVGIFQTYQHCEETWTVLLWFGFRLTEVGEEGKRKGCEWSCEEGLCSLSEQDAG